MTNKNENLENDNSLYAWANGKLVSIAIGLAVGTFIYKSGIITKVLGKFSKKDADTKIDFNSKQRDNQN